MPHIVEDRILESTTTTGTSDVTVVAAITGFRRFSAVCAIGDTVPYFIEAVDTQGLPTGDYEYGTGTYSALNTITRTKVLGSSNAGALVNFTTGTKNVGIPALAGALVPTGAKMEFLGSNVPAGYLELDGSLKSRVQYPALWAYAQASGILIADGGWGTDKGKFSSGDTSTTFRLPDHRGVHSRGWDHGAGIDAGRAIGSSQADQNQSHTHGTSETPHSHGTTETPHTHPYGANVAQISPGAGAPAFSGGVPGNTQGAVTGISINAASTGVTVNASGGTEARVKTVAVLVCVKT